MKSFECFFWISLEDQVKWTQIQFFVPRGKKNNIWKIEIQTKLLARAICSGQWTFLRTRDTGTTRTKLYGIPDVRSPWTIPHTITFARSYTYAAAKGPAHARKGNEAWFQLSGITLLAGCHYLSGYRDWRRKVQVQSSETKDQVIFVRPAILLFDIANRMKKKSETHVCDIYVLK